MAHTRDLSAFALCLTKAWQVYFSFMLPYALAGPQLEIENTVHVVTVKIW